MSERLRTADFYVLLERRGSFNKAAAVAVRTTRPSTTSRQVAVRVRLTVPDSAFDGWVPLVEAVVDGQGIIPPTVEIVEPEPREAGDEENQ